MKLRTASRLSVIVLAVLVGTLLYLIKGPSVFSHVATLKGTDLSVSGAYPAAPAVQLTDQFGKPVSLAQFHGRPVVLTFMYTHCPDECPLTAGKIATTLTQLGPASTGVGVLVVSVDPQGDTQAAALAFSNAHQLANRWHYLIGSCAQLEPIWTAYGVQHSACAAGATAITHSLGLYLIDKQGRERVFLDSEFTPATLAGDLRALAGE